MKIRMNTTSADATGVREAGKVYDVPKDEACLLIEANAAVEADAHGRRVHRRPAQGEE